MMNNIGQILSIAIFLAFFIIGNVHGKKKLQKNADGKKSLKEITNGLENCIKNQNKIDKEKIMPQFSKCITTIENKKSMIKRKVLKVFGKRSLK